MMRVSAVFAIVCLLVVTIPEFMAQTNAPANRVRIGGSEAQVNVIKHVPAVYPAIAANTGIEALTVLEITIDPTGKPKVSRMITTKIRPEQFDTDEYALEFYRAAATAVNQWVYKPFTRDGASVTVVTTVAINFAPPR